MATPTGFEVDVDADADPVLVVVRGELDLSTAPRLAAALDDAAPASSTIALELRGVDFIDSSAISALLTAGRARREAGGRLVIGPRSAAVDRILEITGLKHRSEAFEVLPDGAVGP